MGAARSSLPGWVSGPVALALALALYALGLALHPSGALVVDDEAAYVRQAVAFARGELATSMLDAQAGRMIEASPSNYPIATSLLQVPFVWLGGWQLAPWLSCLSLVALAWCTAKLLRGEGRAPGFALIALGFPAALVLGRVGMSDLPSAAFCALGLLLFFRGIDGHWLAWLGAGLVAGSSLLFRDTNPLLFIPLFAGAVLRGERKALALVAGGLAGLALRVISSQALYGEPWVVRWIPTLGAGYFARAAPYYALVLSVLVPMGLPAVFLFRGRRRLEVMATVVLFLVFFSAYDYSGVESGGAKQLILGPRYFIPLLPLLALCVADAWSRLEGTGSARLGRLARAGAVAWTAGVLIASFAVHPLLWRWGRTQEAIRSDIYALTSEGSLIVTDHKATQKSINEIYGERLVASRRYISPARAIELRDLAPEMFLVFLERADSDFWRESAQGDRAFVAELGRRCELTDVHERSYTATDRLHIWKVGRCDAAPSA